MSSWLKVKVVYGKDKSFDISDRVESIKYSSNTDKDNTVEIKIRKDFARQAADDDRIITGNFLVFSWGVSGGKSSPVIRMKISNVEISYDTRVSMGILGADMGNTAKKINGNDVKKVENATAFIDTFLIPIADMWGLKADYNRQEILDSFDPTTIGSQGHQSGYAWLKKVANKNGFMCFVENKTLVFKKRNLLKKPYKRFEYNNGNGDLISFKPKFRETTEDAASGEVQTISVDPNTGSVVVKNSSDTQDSLGKNLNKYGADAQFAGTEGAKPMLEEEQYNGNRKVIVSPDSGANQNLANKMNQDAQLENHTATIKTLGDPQWFSDTIVSMGNVDRRNSGNWYCISVVHNVPASGDGYTCEAEAQKYGSNAPNKAGAAKTSGKVNSTVGPKDANAKKVVPEYDSNSTQVR